MRHQLVIFRPAPSVRTIAFLSLTGVGLACATDVRCMITPLGSTFCFVCPFASCTHSSTCHITAESPLSSASCTSKAPPPSFVHRRWKHVILVSSAAAAPMRACIHSETATSSSMSWGMRSIEVTGLLSCSSACPSNPQGRIVPVPSDAFAPLHAATCSLVLIVHSVIIFAVSFETTTRRTGAATNFPISFSLASAEPASGVHTSRSLTFFPSDSHSAGMPDVRCRTVRTPDSALKALARAVRTRLLPFSARSVGRAVASRVSLTSKKSKAIWLTW